MNDLISRRPHFMVMRISSKTISLIVIIGSYLALDFLPAQETSVQVEKVSPPSPPYVQQAGSSDGWIIHFPPAPSTAGPTLPGILKQKTLREIDVTKVSDRKREIFVWNDGSTSQHWYYNGVELSQNPDATFVSASNPSVSGTDAAAKAKLDFFDFAWITGDDFVGKAKMGGYDCYYYHRKAAPIASPNNSPKGFMVTAVPRGPVEAWVNIATGLPVAIRDDQGQRTYQFTGGTVSSLTLPPMFQAEYSRYTKALASLKHYQASAPR